MLITNLKEDMNLKFIIYVNGFLQVQKYKLVIDLQKDEDFPGHEINFLCKAKISKYFNLEILFLIYVF